MERIQNIRNYAEQARKSVLNTVGSLSRAARGDVLMRLGAAGLTLATLPAFEGTSRFVASSQGNSDGQSSLLVNVIQSYGVEVARADKPAWPVWGLSKGGLPNEHPELKNQMVGWGLVTDQGNLLELRAGPLEYQDPSGRLFKGEGQSKGDDNATVFIVDGGSPGIMVKVWNGGNWLGITKERNGETYMGAESKEIKLTDSNKAFRDPASGNGKDGKGVKGLVNYCIVDGQTGLIKEMGLLNADGTRTVQFAMEQAASQPAQAPVAAEPQAPAAPAASEPQPAQVQGTPITQNGELQSGVHYVGNKGDILIGDVNVDDVPQNDGNASTGEVVILTQDGQRVDAPFKAGVIHGDPNFETTAQQIATNMQKTGCGTGHGCPDGVDVIHAGVDKPQWQK